MTLMGIQNVRAMRVKRTASGSKEHPA